MGIDKKDVRVVIHRTFALSIDDYVQQAGRAGRDQNRSYCRVYFAHQDISSLSFVAGKDKKAITVKDTQDYCLGTECRHVLLARAFGEEIEPCKISCDFCVNPTAVKKGIEVANSHRKETLDNFRSSR